MTVLVTFNSAIPGTYTLLLPIWQRQGLVFRYVFPLYIPAFILTDLYCLHYLLYKQDNYSFCLLMSYSTILSVAKTTKYPLIR